MALYQTNDLPLGVDLKLSEGQLGKPAVDHSKLASTTELTNADVR